MPTLHVFHISIIVSVLIFETFKMQNFRAESIGFS